MLLSYRSVHSTQHILPDRLQLTNQPFGLCLSLDHELAVSGLALVDRQAELLQPVSQCCEELLPIRFLLTADRQVVRVSTDDDLPGCVMSTPVVYPQVDSIVEKDVGQDRADPRSLRRPDLHRFPSAAL